MAQRDLNLCSVAIGIVTLAIPPIISACISVGYFRGSPKSQPAPTRVLLSAHGAVILIFYLVGWAVFLSGRSNAREVAPTEWVFFTLMAVLIAFSLWKYEGPKGYHWLQLVNLISILWTSIFMAMALADDWP